MNTNHDAHQKCLSWAKSNPLMIRYHDERWCVPCFDDDELFAMLSLEGMQAGLSWEIVINKEASIRAAFLDFDIEKVAKFDEAKVVEILQNTGVIRSRAKINAVINNAKMVLKIKAEFGSFSAYIWGFTGRKRVVHELRDLAEMPAQNELSRAVSKDMKKRGFKFVGPVIIYSYLQGVGVIDDHLVGCPHKNYSEQI